MGKYGKKLTGFTKVEEFLGWLSNHKLFKNDSAS
jgi:hypothetical protein